MPFLIFVFCLVAPNQAVCAFECSLIQDDGSGEVTVLGDLKTWHTITLSLDGPFAEESVSPNPFLGFRFEVTFTHDSAVGQTTFVVPGYFAADGDAANSSAKSGKTWEAKFTPNRVGTWNYQIAFVAGDHVAIDRTAKAKRLAKFDGTKGTFEIQPTDAPENSFRSEGRLQYAGKHHLEFGDSGRAFFKVGPDAPETLLAFSDFDGTKALTPKKGPLKNWQPHVDDWQAGDPTWQGDKGKGLIGAINYLSDKGLNAFSFLTYNIDGDGNNLWPHASPTDKLNFDCSKLAQWQIVFEHAQDRNLLLHIKLQETENDDNRIGNNATDRKVSGALDGGALGVERKIYLRELVARFGHVLNLEWNLGEENTQSFDEQVAMGRYIRDLDPYDHPIVLHTYPDQQDEKYTPHLGADSVLRGVSLQNNWRQTHQRTLYWISKSVEAGMPWVACNDEQGTANQGVPPDEGFEGFSGQVRIGNGKSYDAHDIRKQTLWGNLMAGGGGVMYYFGYELPENDLKCENFRSRDKSWDYCRFAKEFLRDNKIPLNEMTNANSLVGNQDNNYGPYCLTQKDEVYLVYVPNRESVTINLSDAEGIFTGHWFDPMRGGKIQLIEGIEFVAGKEIEIKRPDGLDDWVVIIRKEPSK